MSKVLTKYIENMVVWDSEKFITWANSSFYHELIKVNESNRCHFGPFLVTMLNIMCSWISAKGAFQTGSMICSEIPGIHNTRKYKL